MKRLTLFGVIGLLLISAFSVWAVEEDLIEHADLFPPDTILYVSARIDEDTIGALDALIDQARTVVPLIPPNVSLSDSLEQFVERNLETDIDEIRAWLGDTASIGLPVSMMNSRSNDFTGYLVVDLADSAAALDFFNGKLEELDDDTLQFEEIDGKQVIDSYGVTLEIAEDYMLIAPSEVLNSTREGSLVDNPLFASTLDNLPAEEYGAVVYVDYGAINRANLAMMQDMMGEEMPGFMQMMNPMMEADLAIGIGITILDERNIVFDLVTSPYEMDYGGMEIQTLIPEAVSPEFVENVPADTFFLIHSTNLGSALNLSLTNMEAMGDYFLEQGGLGSFFDMGMGYMSEEERIFLDTFDFGTIAAGARYFFSGITGMSLDDELTWMDGDVAFFARLLPNENTVALPDLAMLIESTESGAPSTFVANFAEALSASEIDFEQENIGDSSAIVFSQLTRESGLADPALDILVAGNDDKFAVGQRTGVSDSITGVDESLADDASYQYAAQYFLPEAQQVWYFGMPALREFVDSEVVAYVRKFDSRSMMSSLEQARMAMALLDSASLTAVMSDDNAVKVRFVISLGDEPAAPLSN